MARHAPLARRSPVHYKSTERKQYAIFTPFHFGPSACISLPLNRYIDFPIFILANVAIDIEPLMVMLFDLSYPLHGLAHTLIGATTIGLSGGILTHYAREPLANLMKTILRLPYNSSIIKYAISGILGTWFHILLDSQLYSDIKPFYPFSNSNPLLGTIQSETMYNYCALAFIPAISIYLILRFIEYKTN